MLWIFIALHLKQIMLGKTLRVKYKIDVKLHLIKKKGVKSIKG